MEYNYLHRFPVQLRFTDIDMLGHATNSVYLQYFDLGKLHYFIDVLKERMEWKEEGLILVNINVSYQTQVKLYDSIEVRSKVVKIGNKSLEMIQQVYNNSTQKVVAESKSVLVGYCGSNDTSIPVPTRWRERIANFEKDIDFGL